MSWNIFFAMISGAIGGAVLTVYAKKKALENNKYKEGA